MPSKVILVLLSFVLLTPVSGLDIQRGKIKATLNERTGRMTVWGTEDPVKPVWTSLYSASDPTTTKWKLLMGDRPFVLGDDAAFTTAVEATATGAQVTWTGKLATITQAIDFVTSVDSQAADGLRITVSIVSNAEAVQKIGLRWVLDTSLGEKKDHFRLANGDKIASETKLDGAFPDYFVSRAADDAPGLLVMVGKGGTVPNRVIFANWKRLDDAPWDPAAKAGRDFNLLPYSFNDSAVASFWDPVDLAPGSSRTVVVLLGLASSKGLGDARLGSANPVDDLLKQTANPSLSAVDQDLASLDTLVAQTDAKLADPSRVSAEDLRLLSAALEQIDQRRKALEATQP